MCLPYHGTRDICLLWHHTWDGESHAALAELILDKRNAPAISRFGTNVFGFPENEDLIEGAKAAIDAVSGFCFHFFGLKSTLSDLNIGDEYFREMAEHAGQAA